MEYKRKGEALGFAAVFVAYNAWFVAFMDGYLLFQLGLAMWTFLVLFCAIFMLLKGELDTACIDKNKS